MGTMDGIIDTVPTVRPLEPLINLLKTNGKVVTTGIAAKPLDLPVLPLDLGKHVTTYRKSVLHCWALIFISGYIYTYEFAITGRKMVAGSGFGGMKETQEMIDFAAEHNITADIEVIPIDYLNTAMERVVKKDVRFRFVIDIENTLKSSC